MWYGGQLYHSEWGLIWNQQALTYNIKYRNIFFRYLFHSNYTHLSKNWSFKYSSAIFIFAYFIFVILIFNTYFNGTPCIFLHCHKNCGKPIFIYPAILTLATLFQNLHKYADDQNNSLIRSQVKILVPSYY